jgi:hypothetical protein
VTRDFKVQEFKVKGKKDRAKFEFRQRENVNCRITNQNAKSKGKYWDRNGCGGRKEA